MSRILRVIALLFLAGSVGYYLWYGLTDQAGSEYGLSWVGPQMIAPIIAVSLVPMVFAFTAASVLSAMSGKNSAAFRDGAIGVGTVTSVTPTGMQLNDQPEVRIELTVESADGRMFASEARMVVAVTELGLVRPGVLLPVRYLPGRTDRVEIDRSGDAASAQEVMNQVMIRKGLTTPARLDIVRRGVSARAVVQSIVAHGEVRDGNPRMIIGVTVTRPDGTTFSTEADRFLMPGVVAQLKIGKVLGVHYLPHDEKEIVLSTPANA
ncbi:MULTISPECIES: hypothetical protein [Actinoalloteichus]|uniref:Uncharacterized protein n=1 Tax=Actinoalloteichus fjordicus TaxID=1612552 RepID=A0AAC9LFA4_9PSEU|nr:MULTISPECIES: hypothetical protein [Actinoalloteichus]APU15707.1 hypothetical protein UA74_18395 [Actinoalloteichus fjordicus]APU21767.1 hypothetical protein UA75_18885 [Actinoalloteichus sp. GBA129-24]